MPPGVGPARASASVRFLAAVKRGAASRDFEVFGADFDGATLQLEKLVQGGARIFFFWTTFLGDFGVIFSPDS